MILEPGTNSPLALQRGPLAIIFHSVTFRGLYCHCILFILTPLRPFLEREVLAVRQRPSSERTRQSVTPIACLRRRVNYLLADVLAAARAGLSGQECSLLYQAIHQRPHLGRRACPRWQTEIKPWGRNEHPATHLQVLAYPQILVFDQPPLIACNMLSSLNMALSLGTTFWMRWFSSGEVALCQLQ
ncbi:TPA: hypothetical protein ACSP2E_003387 [Aeromonas hydrophila]